MRLYEQPVGRIRAAAKYCIGFGWVLTAGGLFMFFIVNLADETSFSGNAVVKAIAEAQLFGAWMVGMLLLLGAAILRALADLVEVQQSGEAE